MSFARIADGADKNIAAGTMKPMIVVNPDACHACGLCATACPEKAIKLVAAGRLA